jgi:hypothetical protein
MAAAEAVTPGAWAALSTTPASGIDGEVVGVDFPTVAMRRAEWVAPPHSHGQLRLTTAPVNGPAVGRPTSWRVTGLGEPSRWTVNASGDVPVETRVDGRDLVVETVVGAHSYTVAEGP